VRMELWANDVIFSLAITDLVPRIHSALICKFRRRQKIVSSEK
jgi:hypothetical protein